MSTELTKAIQDGELELPGPGQLTQSIQPLALRSMFWRPAYLEPSSWQEHIPFAFWVMEAHRPRTFVELGTDWGVSYFAFCQAVEKLLLDTRCFAVDTWQGVEQTGPYDEQVFEKARAYNSAQYSGFSQLVRSSFDEALDYFSNGSVDLLHIDGQHSFEAVSHDFTSWLPKLSERAVVVMHDTNVRERGFGVFKLFEELRAKYPAFEFAHGQGLGVLGVGPEQREILRRLFRSADSEVATRAVQEVFSRLGRACADTHVALQQQESARGMKEAVERQKVELAELAERLLRAKDDLVRMTLERDRALAELRAREAELEQARAALDAAGARAAVAAEATGAPAEATAALPARAAEDAETLDAEKQQLERDKQRLSEAVEARFREIAALTRMLEEKEDAHADLTARLDEHKRRLAALQASKEAESARLQAEKRELEAALEARARERALLAKTLEQKESMLAERDAALRADSARVAELETKCSALVAGNAEALAGAAAAKEEAARLVQQLEERFARELAKKDAELDAQRKRLAKLKKTASWRMTAPVRALAKGLQGAAKEGMPVPRQIELIRASGLFDEAWYKEKYPDVATGDADPVEHYVRYGAAEGRDPSARFSTRGYLAAHPRLKPAVENPLVHCIQHGEKPEWPASSSDVTPAAESRAGAPAGARSLGRLAGMLLDRARRVR